MNIQVPWYLRHKSKPMGIAANSAGYKNSRQQIIFPSFIWCSTQSNHMRIYDHSPLLARIGMIPARHPVTIGKIPSQNNHYTRPEWKWYPARINTISGQNKYDTDSIEEVTQRTAENSVTKSYYQVLYRSCCCQHGNTFGVTELEPQIS